MPYGSLSADCEEHLDPAGTGSFYNEGEADIVVQHVSCLINSGNLYDHSYIPLLYIHIYFRCGIYDIVMNAGVSPTAIAVQSPYVAQVQLLRDRFDEFPEADGVEVATIDSFQGREADAVIISMVGVSSFANYCCFCFMITGNGLLIFWFLLCVLRYVQTISVLLGF